MGKTFFTSLLASIKNFYTANYYNPEQGRIETLVFRLPRYRLLLGVMGMNKEFKGVRGGRKKSGTRHILCGFTNIFALLSS